MDSQDAAPATPLRHNAAPGARDTPLNRLLAEPERFGYFQALRLLLLSRPADAGHGPAGPGGGELLRAADAAVRLSVPASSAFPAGEIQSLREDGAAARPSTGEAAPGAEPSPASGSSTAGRPRIQVNFMGLTGPSGVLPLHYTEWLAQRRRQRDDGPAAFLDMFNHRALLLFWTAWARNQPAIMQELARGQGVMRHVYDLIGMGTRGLLPAPGRAGQANRASQTSQPKRGGERAALPPRQSLGYYSGLIAQRPHSDGALARILGDFCQAPVSAAPCLGTWQPIPAGQRTRLWHEGARLGQGAVLGTRYWDRQTTLRLRIGPLDRRRFHGLLPGQGRLEAAVALARFLTGVALDLRIQLRLAAGELRPLRLNSSPAKDGMPARLGWNTWLAGRPDSRPADDCEFHFHATGAQSWR